VEARRTQAEALPAVAAVVVEAVAAPTVVAAEAAANTEMDFRQPEPK
jgi:hypothetical protein